MALNSQMRAVAAIEADHLAREICPVTLPQKKGDPVQFSIASECANRPRSRSPEYDFAPGKRILC